MSIGWASRPETIRNVLTYNEFLDLLIPLEASKILLWYDVVSLPSWHVRPDNQVDDGKIMTYGFTANSENQKKRAKLIHGVDANTV